MDPGLLVDQSMCPCFSLNLSTSRTKEKRERRRKKKPLSGLTAELDTQALVGDFTDQGGGLC